MFDQCLTNAMKASINKGGSFMATPTKPLQLQRLFILHPLPYSLNYEST
jgi:hypothetical protein